MGKIGEVLGRGEPVEYKGKAYQLRRLTYDKIADYEHWLELRAVKAAIRLRAALPPAEGAEYMRGVRADIGAGMYSWDAPVCANSLYTPRGLAKACHLAMTPDGPEADGPTEELVNEWASGLEALALQQAFQRVHGMPVSTPAGEDADPKAAKTTTTADG